MRSVRSLVLLGLVFVVSAAAGAGGVALGRHRSSAIGPTAISVAEGDCGQGWDRPGPGPRTVLLRNLGGVPSDAQLVDLATGGVLVEVEGIGVGAVTPVRIRLGGGRYAWRCVPQDLRAVTGPQVRVAGPPGPSGVPPVTREELIAPVATYQAAMLAGMTPLLADTTVLRAAVAGGDRAAAERAWLPAHLDYERLGPAYGAFGDLDTAINGDPDGLPGGVADPGFTGFRRLEYGLWHDQPMAALQPVAATLLASVSALRAQAPKAAVDSLDLTRRAHEILEDTERFELTGESDQGSGTSLATARAQVDATTTALAALRPLLLTRYQGLARTEAALDALAAALDATRVAGGWAPVQGLDHTGRQRINALAGQAVELLAPVAAILEPRRTS